jgi:D-mannonate dehydratase
MMAGTQNIPPVTTQNASEKHFRVNFKHFRDDDKFKKNNFFEEGNKNGVEEIEIKKSFD